MNKVYLGDCLDLMQDIPDGSIDMILCDLPYGTTEAVWDFVIDPFDLWLEYRRIIKESGVIVLTAQNPFTSKLVCSNIDWYKHSFVWEKDKCANFLAGKYQPLKIHEDVLIFAKGGFTHNAKIKCTYNPQLTNRKARLATQEQEKSEGLKALLPRPNPTKLKSSSDFKADKNLAKSVIYFPTEHFSRVHPTQKPLGLFEYLIRTYSNEGETVLDNCAGSGTTAIACLNTKRNYICIEKDPEYFDIIQGRILEYHRQPQLF